MPLTYHHKTDILQLGIWKSSEPMEELEQLAGLSESEIMLVQSFKSELRKRIPERTRIAAQHASGFIAGNSIRREWKTLSRQHAFIVHISHAGLCLGFVLSPALCRPGSGNHSSSDWKDRAQICQRRGGKIHRWKNRRQHLHILWGAKEVLYKIYGKGNVDFRGHLSVAPFQCTDKGSTEATIRMPDFERTFLVHFEKQKTACWPMPPVNDSRLLCIFVSNI